MSVFWIIAGESSGDSYGARLAAALMDLAPDCRVRGMGGDAMREAGVDIMVDSTDLAVVGFIEVLKHLRTFRQIFNDLVRRARDDRPDAVVLIDYPGFNVRLATKLHAMGITVVYYVSPQVWAWGKRRIPKLARCVDKMLVIFPFEPTVFQHTDLDVAFVGHPLVDILEEYRDPAVRRDPNTVALLPGSRSGEIDRLLEPLLRIAAWLAQRHRQLTFVLPVPNRHLQARVSERIVELRQACDDIPAVEVMTGQTRKCLQRADVGIAASGTVTVEAAIFGLPLVVVYKLHPVTYWLARLLVKIPHFTMVNLVRHRLVYEEFLQGAVTAERVGRAVEAIMRGGARRAEVESEMAAAVRALGGRTNACRQAAEAVLAAAERNDDSTGESAERRQGKTVKA